MSQYEILLRYVFEKGVLKFDRIGAGTKSIFGYQTRFDLSEGFPLVTTKKIHLRLIIYGLLWILKDDTNIKYLKENNVNIWDEWADEYGEIGPVYGYQLRSWPTQEVKHIDQIGNNPDSRRIIVSAWNGSDLNKMALQPCHSFFQFYVREGKLTYQMYKLSSDMFLGVSFNIASYALLTMMVAQVFCLEVYEFVHTFGDKHFTITILNKLKSNYPAILGRIPK